MTREENVRAIIECCFSQTDKDIRETAIKNIVKSLQSENEFISSAEDYRLRLIQIFHNTHCEEFISFMVLPTESDLNMLEDMLREHYKDTVPCDDAISRDAFITRYKEWMRSERGKIPNDDTLAIRVIESLPSVRPQEPKTEWIPVSERLPENFQRVLVTVVNYDGYKVVRVAEYYGRQRIFQIKENHEQWEVGEKGLLAWRPLPEPYKAESEE